MKSILLLFLLATVAAAGQGSSITNPAYTPTVLPPASIVVAWSASPTAATEPITYTVWYGTNSGVYFTNQPMGTNLAASITNLTRGVTWYFAVQAADVNSNLSAFSSPEVTSLWVAVPLPPAGFHVTYVSP